MNIKRTKLYMLVTGYILAGLAIVAIAPTNVQAASTAIACPGDTAIIGFPTWFHGLKCVEDSNTKIVSVDLGGDINKIWVIVLNIVQWLIMAAAYVAVYFVIWSGFKYITAAGEPDKIKEAKNTLTNAIIGLIIAMIAVAIVQTIQAAVAGTIK